METFIETVDADVEIRQRVVGVARWERKYRRISWSAVRDPVVIGEVDQATTQ